MLEKRLLIPKLIAKGYEKWVEMSIQKQIDKAKSVKGKDKYTNMQKEYVREVKKHTTNLNTNNHISKLFG